MRPGGGGSVPAAHSVALNATLSARAGAVSSVPLRTCSLQLPGTARGEAGDGCWPSPSTLTLAGHEGTPETLCWPVACSPPVWVGKLCRRKPPSGRSAPATRSPSPSWKRAEPRARASCQSESGTSPGRRQREPRQTARDKSVRGRAAAWLGAPQPCTRASGHHSQRPGQDPHARSGKQTTETNK